MPFAVPIGQSAGGAGYWDYPLPSEGSALSPFTNEQEARLRETVRGECRAAHQAQENPAPHTQRTERSGLMTSDETTRLECLKLALDREDIDAAATVDRARAYAEFVLDKKSERDA